MTDTPSPPTTWLQSLIRARHILLTLFIVVVGAVVWDLLFSGDSILLRGDSGVLRGWESIKENWKPVSLIVAILLVAPTLFLMGVPHLRWPQPTRARWIGITMTLGALWAALLSAGIGAALFSLIFRRKDIGDALDSVAGSSLGLLFIIAIPWTGWLLFFAMILAGEWIVVFRRMYRLLLAGTCLELLITIPIDIHVRKRTQCYCGEGSFWALTIGITMAFWTFGPGIVLLYLARRMQRTNSVRCCGCGYDLRGLSGRRCPECGKVVRRGPTNPEA